MFARREPGEITTWFVVFWPQVRNKWLTRIIPGRFKHVALFGHSPECHTWVFIDTMTWGSACHLVPDADADRFIASFVDGRAVLKLERKNHAASSLRLISCCTQTVRHILGLKGWGLFSAIPDRLYRDCLAAGAVAVA